MSKKAITLILIMLMGLFAPFSALASEEPAAFELSPEEAKYLDSIRDTPISLAITSELVSFDNLQGDKSGLLQPMIGLMENSWGLTVETVNPGWDESFRMLESGEVDMLGLAILSDKRRQIYKATDTLFTSNMDIYSCNDTPVGSIVDLKGKTIGLLSNSVLPEMLEVYLTPEGSIKYYKTVDELISALENGEIFCVAISLTITSELLDHPNVQYEMSVESVITPQCVYSGNRRLDPLIDLINRYIASPEGAAMLDEINSNRRKCTLEKYSEFYKDDIAYVKDNYDKLQIFDSGMMYPLSYVKDGQYYGLQNEINGIVSELTGLPVETLNYSHFAGVDNIIDALKKKDILAIAGIHRINDYSRDESLEYSLPLMVDTLSFYVRQDNTLTSLSDMRVGSLYFGNSYMDWKINKCKELKTYASRGILIEDLRSGKLDAIFMGEMMTDYYYTVLNDYMLKRLDNLTVPASVHMLYNADNESFNNVMNIAVTLQAVVNPTDRQRWDNNSQNGKFELMWLKDRMNVYQTRTIMWAVMLVFVLALLLLIVAYQLRKFSNFDKQISRMLSVQGNADMLWGNLKTNKLISKGDYPILKKLGFSEEFSDNLMNVKSLKKDIEIIGEQGLAYYMRDLEIKSKDSDITYFFRRFTHKINENEFMVYLMDFTAEKYHERKLSKLANTDHLTKLFNRRAMDKLLSKKVEGLSASSGRVFIFMLDIDNFKCVNDNYGHDIGDKVLELVSRIVEMFFSNENVARWGGEEFLGVAELESGEEAVELAQKILTEFESTEITVGTRDSFYSTISCGISELMVGEAYENAVARADKAMYQAKCDGKNCVRFIDVRMKTVDLANASPDSLQGVEAFEASVAYNRIMSRFVHALLHSRNIDTVILEFLRITAVQNGLDRAFLLEKTLEDSFIRTYLYDPQDLASTNSNGELKVADIERFGKFAIAEPRFVSDAITEISEEELAIRAKGLRSFAELPIIVNDKLIGFVGFDNCRETHEWTNDERRILSDISVILGEFILRKNLEIKLMQSNAAMDTVLNSLDDIVYVVEFGTRKLLFANQKMREYVKTDDLDGKACWEVFRPDFGGPCPFCIHKNLVDENGKPAYKSIGQEVFNDLEGEWFYATNTVIDWENGERAVVMVCRDITAQKHKDISMENVLADLERQKSVMDFALENSLSFSWEYIPSSDSFTVNKNAEQVLGYPISGSGKNISIHEYFSGMAFDYARDTEKKLNDYINGLTDIYTAEYPMLTSQGEIKWYLDRGRYAGDRHDVIYGVCTDVTENKIYEQRLSERAYRDSMTGLYNKQYLADGLLKPIQDVFRNFGGILLDIRSFKNINEAFGSDYGDRIIESIAGRLRDMFFGKNIFRISGDIFFAVFENTSMKALENHTKKVLDEFKNPVFTDGQMVRVNFKVGVALVDVPDAAKLLDEAEIALHSAKESMIDDYRMINDSIKLAFSRKANMEFELVKAVERKEFVMYYQPKIMAGTHQVVGAEALIRWVHPQLGIVPPLDFIPLAEETGQIIPIGEFVIYETAKQLRQWLDGGMDIFLSFNLSAKQFLSPHLNHHIYTAMKRYEIPPGRFVIEITESTMISDSDHVRQVLKELHSFGIGVSLDDFGTGYSSMNYLGKIPLDYLKIDKSFIDNATTVSKDRAILESILMISHKLGFQVTAEGVETVEQLQMLEELGCDIIQGFYFSKPLPKDKFEEYIKALNE